jgi:23S rRNA U2552 (ribose-2'-O)-methylase RlmE/FtsJ
MSTYKPFIFKLPTIDVSDMYKDNSVITTTNMNQPLISLGFHSFIHRTRDAMSITNKLETKNKFYYVVNPFEHTINDYKESISQVADVYLNKPNIVSRYFYKMWEMLYMFDLASKDKMVMTGLAEGPGSFIQAFVEFREQFNDPSKDTVYGQSMTDIDKEMVSSMNKRYENMIDVIKNSTDAKPKKGTTKTTLLPTDGDLTKVATIDYIVNNIKEPVDLVTADGSIIPTNLNFIEQESYALILGEIITAIRISAKGGSFILKVFDTFTHITIKLIGLLTSFYNEIYLYKPFMSRDTNQERYIICKGFQYEHKDPKLANKIKMLEETLKNCKTDIFINDIFPKLHIKEDVLNTFKYINITQTNIQQININKVVTYIKSNNYFGDMYHGYREGQIRANKWWIDHFFTEKYNDMSALVKETCSYNDSEMHLFVKKLI